MVLIIKLFTHYIIDAIFILFSIIYIYIYMYYDAESTRNSYSGKLNAGVTYFGRKFIYHI